MAKDTKKPDKKPSAKTEQHVPKPSPIKIYKPDIRFAFIAALAGLLLYANTLKNYYVLDDYAVVLNNQFVQQGIKGIPKIFTSDIWHFENVNLGYYRPLSLVTFAIEHQFFPNNPTAGHAGNIFFYTLTGFFLCLLLMRIFKNYPPLFSLMVSLIFIAHPIHTEVVANIKSRDEMLSFLNLIIALYLFLQSLPAAVGRQHSSVKPFVSGFNYKYLVPSLAFFYLALLSKESAMSGVLLAPLVVYFANRFSLKQVALASLPFLVLVLLFQVNKYVALGTITGDKLSGVIDYPYYNSGQMVPATFALVAWCIKMTLIPYPLAYSYAYNQIPVNGWGQLNVIAGLVITAVLLLLVIRLRNNKNALLFGLLFFGITLIPGLAFVFLKGGMFAERFLYSPVLGFSIIIGALLFKAFSARFEGPVIRDFVSDWRLSVPVLLLLGAYSFETVNRNADWLDGFTLRTKDVEAVPNNAQVHLHYGAELVEAGIGEPNAQVKAVNFRMGITQLNRAVQIYSSLPAAYNEMGRAWQFLAGNADSAILYYNRAIFEGPTYAPGHYALATMYQQTGQQQLASYYFNKGAELDPFDRAGMQARIEHQKVTGLNVTTFPGIGTVSDAELNDNTKDFLYYDNKGQEYGKKGDFGNAIKFLDKSIQLNPRYVDTWLNLSVCYGMSKNFDKCIESLNKVLEIDPNNPTALNNMALTYYQLGQKAKGDEYQAKVNALQVK